jgi:hypothetical protein
MVGANISASDFSPWSRGGGWAQGARRLKISARRKGINFAAWRRRSAGSNNHPLHLVEVHVHARLTTRESGEFISMSPRAQFGFHRLHVRFQLLDRRHMMSAEPLPSGPVLREAALCGEMRQVSSLPADCPLRRRDACVDFRDALVAVISHICSLPKYLIKDIINYRNAEI